MADIIEICREAWDKTKAPHQPVYDDLVQAYRDMLQARAEAAMTGSLEAGPFESFESYVYGYTREAQPPAPPEVESEPEMVRVTNEEPEVVEPPKKKAPAKKPAAKKPVKVVKKAVVKVAKKK